MSTSDDLGGPEGTDPELARALERLIEHGAPGSSVSLTSVRTRARRRRTARQTGLGACALVLVGAVAVGGTELGHWVDRDVSPSVTPTPQVTQPGPGPSDTRSPDGPIDPEDVSWDRCGTGMVMYDRPVNADIFLRPEPETTVGSAVPWEVAIGNADERVLAGSAPRSLKDLRVYAMTPRGVIVGVPVVTTDVVTADIPVLRPGGPPGVDRVWLPGETVLLDCATRDGSVLPAGAYDLWAEATLLVDDLEVPVTSYEPAAVMLVDPDAAPPETVDLARVSWGLCGSTPSQLPQTPATPYLMLFSVADGVQVAEPWIWSVTALSTSDVVRLLDAALRDVSVVATSGGRVVGVASEVGPREPWPVPVYMPGGADDGGLFGSSTMLDCAARDGSVLQAGDYEAYAVGAVVKGGGVAGEEQFVSSPAFLHVVGELGSTASPEQPTPSEPVDPATVDWGLCGVLAADLLPADYLERPLARPIEPGFAVDVPDIFVPVGADWEWPLLLISDDPTMRSSPVSVRDVAMVAEDDDGRIVGVSARVEATEPVGLTVYASGRFEDDQLRGSSTMLDCSSRDGSLLPEGHYLLRAQLTLVTADGEERLTTADFISMAVTRTGEPPLMVP